MNAKGKWDKENTKSVTLKLFRKRDAEVIARLDQQENRTDYIRQLILADIKKSKNFSKNP